jgi:hypothetical protein
MKNITRLFAVLLCLCGADASLEQLTSWSSRVPRVPDAHGRPIHRPAASWSFILRHAVGTQSPLVYAAFLDVLAARESSYDFAAVGDNGDSCGAWQTRCEETPMPDGWRTEWAAAEAAEGKGELKPLHRIAHQHRVEQLTTEIKVGQIKRAIKSLDWAVSQCPEHPLWHYAAGHCAPSPAGIERERLAHELLRTPLEEP